VYSLLRSVPPIPALHPGPPACDRRFYLLPSQGACFSGLAFVGICGSVSRGPQYCKAWVTTQTVRSPTDCVNDSVTSQCRVRQYQGFPQPYALIVLVLCPAIHGSHHCLAEA
jgi:hypothetical protein